MDDIINTYLVYSMINLKVQINNLSKYKIIIAVIHVLFIFIGQCYTSN